MPAVTVIDALPRFVTPQEHAEIVSRTPESFASIPSVLRHKQDNVTVSLDPPIAEFNDDNKGSIYVVESALLFFTPSSRGFSIQYPKITLHAVSRSEDTGPYVYCQLDETADGVEVTEDEDAEMSELKIIPGDMVGVEAIFEALSHCASLHPDPNAPPEEVESDGDMYDSEVFTGNPEEELSEVGRAALAHLESITFPRATEQADDPTTEDAKEGKHEINGTQ